MKTVDFVVDRIAECPSGIIDSLKTALKRKEAEQTPRAKESKRLQPPTPIREASASPSQVVSPHNAFKHLGSTPMIRSANRQPLGSATESKPRSVSSSL